MMILRKESYPKKRILEEGWLYFVSPDKNTLVRLRDLGAGTWEKELFVLRPTFKLGHPMRNVQSDATYPLPESFSHWHKLTTKSGEAVLLQGFHLEE